MPTKRTKITRNRVPTLTAEAVAAFKAGDAMALSAELRLRPWWPNPLDVDTDTPPEIYLGTPYGDAWPEVRRIRLALEAALSD